MPFTISQSLGNSFCEMNSCRLWCKLWCNLRIPVSGWCRAPCRAARPGSRRMTWLQSGRNCADCLRCHRRLTTTAPPPAAERDRCRAGPAVLQSRHLPARTAPLQHSPAAMSGILPAKCEPSSYRSGYAMLFAGGIWRVFVVVAVMQVFRHSDKQYIYFPELGAMSAVT